MKLRPLPTWAAVLILSLAPIAGVGLAALWMTFGR